MNLLNIIKQIGKGGFLESNRKTNALSIKSACDQILDNLRSISESSDNPNYYWIITAMKNHLNYNEVEFLVYLTNDLPNRNFFLSVLEKKKYFWYSKIESEYYNDIKNAKLSLCTSDFLAFIIGKKYDLHLLINENSFWSTVYTDLDLELNDLLLQNNFVCNLEGSQKAHVPVNYALSMFLLFNKKEALVKFKRILNDDRNGRLDTSYQTEYFIIVGKFFERLKLEFIPQIDSLNRFVPIKFENQYDEYITRGEIQSVIDKEDYFNQGTFKVDIKKLLTPSNIIKKELLRDSYFMFFNSIDSQFKIKNIEILISCFTEVNPKYDEFEIKNAKVILGALLSIDKNKSRFLILNHYLNQKDVFSGAMNKLAFLLDEFFSKVDGMRIDTNRSILHNRKLVDSDWAIPVELKNYIKNH